MVAQAGGIEVCLATMQLYSHSTTKSDWDLSGEHRFAAVASGILTLGIVDAMHRIQRASGIAVVCDVMREPFANARLADKLDLHSVLSALPCLCITVATEYDAVRLSLFIQI
jgi:hypothetical protein